ncbi:MAG: putative ABC transport system permease protein [Pseudohongiellaceae bacterium]|jgi:putative ABC transport system permease protein
MRSLLTGLSVTFGAAVLLILLSYATGVPDTTADVLRSMGSREYIVEPRWRGRGRGGKRVRIRYTDLPALREACPSIEQLAPAYSPGRGGPLFSRNRSWPWANVTGVGHEYQDVTDLRIDEGRWFTQEEEFAGEEVALISRPLVDGMFDGRTPLGEVVDARGVRFRVIGVFESKATFAYSLLVPYPTAMAMGDEGGRYVSHIAFAPLRGDLAESAVSEMRQALGTLYSFPPDDNGAIDIKENTAFVAKVEAVSVGLTVLVWIIASLALVLGCLGAANVVGIAVSERTSELGLRKALGATASRLRAEVLTETLLLCVAGGLLGVTLGAAAIAALGPLQLTDQARLTPEADGQQLALACLVLVVTATLAGLPAANRAAGLDPVQALRDE